MKPDDIVRYADRIYGYAVKRTFSATKPTSFRRKSSAPRSVRSPPELPQAKPLYAPGAFYAPGA